MEHKILIVAFIKFVRVLTNCANRRQNISYISHPLEQIMNNNENQLELFATWKISSVFGLPSLFLFSGWLK